MAEISEPQELLELPGMYFNGFQIGITNADVSAVLMLNGQPQSVVNFSYTTAKSLGKALETLVGQLESATGRPIMITKEVDTAMADIQKKRSAEK